jgi:chromosome transmission fidelity protein 18
VILIFCFSDERMGNSVITKISSVLEVRTSFTSDRKPTMIVIDEIDGAAAAGNENNLIKYLVKIATAKNSGNKKGSRSTNAVENDQSESETDENEKQFASKAKKKSGTEKIGLLHPIICICNDLYVPALRPLRQVAHVLQVKPIGPVQLSLRLKTICDREGLKINTRTLVDLAEIMGSDVRSTLNALQFIHKKSISGSAISFNRELTFGAFKDTVKPPMKVYDAIFHNIVSSNSIKKNGPNQNICCNSGRKYSELLEMVWGSGLEMDKLMNGCFEIYPTVKFFDNTTMDRVNSALELFSSFDLMNCSTSSSNYDGYLAYKLCGLKDLFSSPVYTSIKYPREDFENFQFNSEIKAIFKDYLSSLSAKIRSESGPRDSLLMERIPAVLYSSLSQFTNIKSSNPQLMRLEEKQKITKSVKILASEGLVLRQIKIPDSASYKFVLDPPIDRLNLDHLNFTLGEPVFSKVYDNETVQDSHTYSICRLVATEMEALRIRKQKLKLAASNVTAESPQSSTESTPVSGAKRKIIDISQVTLPKDLKKRVARDFFGRPIAIVDDNQNLKPEKDVKELKMSIWYVQNDGVSNAVRRNIKISSFLN